jgi:hypothetical protein
MRAWRNAFLGIITVWAELTKVTPEEANVQLHAHVKLYHIQKHGKLKIVCASILRYQYTIH